MMKIFHLRCNSFNRWFSCIPRIQLRLFNSAIPLLCVFTILVLVSCGVLGLSIQEKHFTEQYPYEDVNDSLALRPIEGVTNTDLTEVVTILLENRIDLTISILPESDIVGLAYDTETEKWVEVKNAVEYPDKGWLIGPRGGEIPSSTAIYFQPDLVSPTNSIEVRIVVIGHVWDEAQGAGEAMAAYLDLTLEK
jgi:hypothetical protein